MASMNPTFSARLADAVYELTRSASIKDAITNLNGIYKGDLVFSEDIMLKAKTGGPWFIKCRTAFGFTLLGQGPLKGHAFFIFRGTQYLADWLTNLNISVSRSSTGQPLHDGFKSAFKTMEPQLKEFMSSVEKSNITHIHCIGHSLGGALATICGDWIKTAYKRTPYIYTFGSPRVGLYGFAQGCTSRVGADHIFRAYHKTDIVPCIPVWPFMHTPISGQDYYLPSPGIIPMAEYHAMKHYIASVSGKSWSNLAALKAESKNDDGIVRWLKSTAPVGFGITVLEWLAQAMAYVLKRCLNGVAWGISAAFTSSFTLMDQLAYILKKGIDISAQMSSLVLQLIRKIMEILGMKRALEAADLTRDFIRGLLLKLQAFVNKYGQQALSHTLVKGRSV